MGKKAEGRTRSDTVSRQQQTDMAKKVDELIKESNTKEAKIAVLEQVNRSQEIHIDLYIIDYNDSLVICGHVLSVIFLGRKWRMQRRG